MSKNIKLNDTEYQGISTVQLPTTDDKTASFMDVDEMVIPTGTVEINQNGMIDVLNFAMANVNVSSGGGSYETGTFVGDGTNYVTLPVTSKKIGYIIMVNDYKNVVANEIATLPSQSVFYEMYDSRCNFYGNRRSFNGSVTAGVWDATSDVIKKVVFSDDAITKTTHLGFGTESYINGKTYTWIAW